MLRAARLGWEAGGLKVIGAAIAARTAADLEAGTGIPSSSLAQILVDLRESGGLSKHHVIVVDEASLVGTRALDELRSRVEPTGAKVVRSVTTGSSPPSMPEGRSGPWPANSDPTWSPSPPTAAKVVPTSSGSVTLW
jgi:ATP-dependent exoDNAse (exonuclease V) alpha subunit